MQDAKSVHVLLGEVLAELPAIGKNSEMLVGQKYKYRGIEDVLNALNPLLSERGLVVAPVRVDIVSESQRESRGGGAMFNVRLVVQYRWYGPAGDSLIAAGCGEATDSGDKAVQKAMTSAFKYMLFETLCISTEEGNASDVDRTSSEEQEAVLSPQEQRKKEWGDKPLPDGWESFEQFDTDHQTYLAGMKDLPKLEQDYMKKWRKDQDIPWPCSNEQMEALCAEVVRMKSEAFGAADEPVPAADEAEPQPEPTTLPGE